MVSFTSSNDDDYKDDEYSHLTDANNPHSEHQIPPDSSFNHYDKIFSDSHSMNL